MTESADGMANSLSCDRQSENQYRNGHHPYHRSITVSLVAVILCYLARTIGVNSDPQVLSITADYRWLGWTLRIVAAILAAVALLILFLDRQGTRRSFVPRNLARLGIGLAIAALFWEIAVPAATIAFLVLGIWAFFTGPGDAGELGDLDFDIVD